ncbi:MAG: (Fe-S)-binding protein [Actinomycetota bacterium]|nr:(Fe-S)-binding protein [Actinomycetota bacterium]
MKRKKFPTKEALPELREDFSLCGKCKLCQAVMAQQCEEPRFWRNCPSGTRFRFDAYYASGKLEIARCLDLAEIEPDDKMRHIVYSCMLCGSCDDRCYPVKQLHPLWVFERLREQAVEDEWAPLDWFSDMLSNLEKFDNPYGIPSKERVKWADGLDIKNAFENEVEYVLFVGDEYSSFDSLKPRIRAVAQFLTKAGVDFGILGEKEVSSGSSALLIGDREFFWTFAEENLKSFADAGCKKVITADAHAYAVIKEEYTKLTELEVYHITEVAAKLSKENSFKPEKKLKLKAAYHDPCRIGRRHLILDEPRDVLEKIPGLELVEFERNRKNSLCCGGGGGVFWWEPQFVRGVTDERLFEADFVGAEGIITACPLCVKIFEDAIGDSGRKIKVLDFCEALLMAL